MTPTCGPAHLALVRDAVLVLGAKEACLFRQVATPVIIIRDRLNRMCTSDSELVVTVSV